jgi:hypothetical protein
MRILCQYYETLSHMGFNYVTEWNCKKLLHIAHLTARVFYTRPSKLTDAVIRNRS